MPYIEELFAGAAGILMLAVIVWALMGFPMPRSEQQKAQDIYLVKKETPTGETRLERQRADGEIVPRSRNQEIFRFALWVLAVALLPVACIAAWQGAFEGADEVLFYLAFGVVVSTGYYIYRIWVERKAPWTHEPSPTRDKQSPSDL